jgi:hypothetical protein
MIGDFPSKPLLGRKFKKHRSLMMNTKWDSRLGASQVLGKQSTYYIFS